ncbi:MAG: serine/threonine-protein kinase [Polyangia bacterium]
MSSLIVERVNGRGATFLRLSGRIDETFAAEQLGALDAPLAFDVSGVTAITSFGVRGFSKVLAGLAEPTYFLDCPPCLVDQINLIAGFLGPAEVISARAYFACACGEELLCRIDLLEEGARMRSGRPPDALCVQCGSTMRLIEDDTFRFASTKAARKLDPRVGAMLAKLGLYDPTALEDRPLSVRKVVDGADVALRLDGAFAEWTRLERAADDDGIVVLQVAGLIVRADGAEPFQRLLSALGRRARELVLLDLPPQLAGLLAAKMIDLGRGKVASLLVPVRCDACQELSLASLPLHTSDHVLRCPRCGESARSLAANTSLAALRVNGAPSAEAATLAEKLDGLFSQAAVEAKLVSQPRVDGLDMELPATIGGYRIVRPLSAGGMAEVLVATRPSFGGVEKVVALKRFRRELFQAAPAAIAMFLAEARLAAQLSHPNVVQIFDVGESDGDLYMAMEMIDGRDLRDVVDVGDPVPPHIVAHLGLDIARALAYLHSAHDLRGRELKIVHRDVSPQNVLVDRNGRVVLIDFGVALAGEGELQKRRRKVAGNIAYMSPEQCYGEPLDGRSDLFSLGVVMWELLAAAPLFRRYQAAETRAALLAGVVPDLPLGTPPELDALVRKLLSLERQHRPRSADEVVRTLDAMMPDIGGRISALEVGTFVLTASTLRGERRPEHLGRASARLEPSAKPQVKAGKWRYALAAAAAICGFAVVWLATH